MTSTLQICFKLEPVDEIAPWGGSGGQLNLHWFGLTSGNYWISTPLGEVLRYTTEQQKIWNLTSPYVDYNIARLFEDIQDILPFALEPVPADIAALSADRAWHARSVEWMERGEESDERLDLWYRANQWWNDRHIDTGYMTSGPNFHFWRVADQVFIRWEQHSGPAGVWEKPSGQFAIDVAEFQPAVFDFLDKVIMQMGERVQTIATNGWTRPECDLDIQALVREQRERAALVNKNKERRPHTDWNSVRNLLDRLQEELRQE